MLLLLRINLETVSVANNGSSGQGFLFLTHLLQGESTSATVSGSVSNGGMTGWDGKIYTNPPVIKAKGYDRTYFDETQSRPIQEAQEIIERAKTLSSPVKIFDEATDVIEKLKSEITKLQCMEEELSGVGREIEAMRAKIAIEQMRSQIEEIDVIFVMMIISTQIH